jgi:hypothetical protein
MVIAYKNTPDDAAAWYHYYWTQTEKGRRAIRRSRIMHGLCCASFAACFLTIKRLIFGGIYVPLDYLIFPAIAFLGSYMMASANLKRYVREQVQKQISSGDLNDFFYPLSLEPLAEGMRIDWNGRSTVVDWSLLTKSHQANTH